MDIRIRLIVESGNMVLTDITSEHPNLEVTYPNVVIIPDEDEVHILRGSRLVPDIETVKQGALF